jgi:hypothetical protein
MQQRTETIRTRKHPYKQAAPRGHQHTQTQPLISACTKHARAHTHTQRQTDRPTHKHTHTHTQAHAQNAPALAHARAHARTHTHTHTHTKTRICAYAREQAHNRARSNEPLGAVATAPVDTRELRPAPPPPTPPPPPLPTARRDAAAGVLSVEGAPAAAPPALEADAEETSLRKTKSCRKVILSTRALVQRQGNIAEQKQNGTEKSTGLP